MALKNTALTVTYEAWDVSTAPAARLSGDVANHTVTISKDGGSASAATNSPAEIGSTGRYKITLTATERNADHVRVLVVSSTVNVLCSDVVDYPETNNSGVGENATTITVQDSDTNTLGGVNVVVQTAGGVTVASGSTNESTGQISFNLDNGTYLVYLKKSQYESQVPTAANLTVSGDTSQTYTISYISPTTPSASNQTITGNVLLITGSAASSAKVSAKVKISDQKVGSSFLAMQATSSDADSNGDFEIEVLQGAQITVSIYDDSKLIWENDITVTTDSTKDLSTY